MLKNEIVSNIRENYKRVSSIFLSKKRLDIINEYINANFSFKYSKYFFILTSIALCIILLNDKYFAKENIIILIFVVITFTFLPSVIVYFGLEFFYYFKKKKKFYDKKAEIDVEVNRIKENLEQLDKYCLLPKKYQNLHSMEKILEYFENLRVDSIKEAINLFEDESLKYESIKQMKILSNKQNIMINHQRSMVFQQGLTNSLLMWKRYR